MHAALLLRALIAAEADARPAAVAWIAQADLDSLDSDAAIVLPGLYPRAHALGIEHPAMPTLKGIHRHHWYRNRLLLHAALPAARALAAAGIRPLWLGPATLVPLHYRDWGARCVAGVDLLIAAQQVPAAVGHVARAGWTRTDRVREPLGSAVLSSRASLLFRDANGFELRLHWRLFDWRLTPGADAGRWVDRAPTVEIEGTPVVVMEPTDLLLHAVAAEPAPRGALPWAADAAAILRGGAIDWQRLRARTRACGLGVLPAHRLAMLRAMCPDLIPPAALDALGARAAAGIAPFPDRPVRPRAALGPALYRMARHLWRYAGACRDDPAYRRPDGFVRFLQEVHDLPRRRDVPAYFLRSGRAVLGRALRHPYPRGE